jgi:hypothetical protein
MLVDEVRASAQTAGFGSFIRKASSHLRRNEC